MKKILIAIAALTLAVSVPAQAQGFLNKLKEKAEQAVGGAVSGALGNVLGDKVQDIVPENVKDMAGSLSGQDDSGNAPSVVTGEQAFPPRRASTFGWDGPVTPSSAKFPVPLMNEFPPVPAASDLVNPVESKQIAYYQAIKAVTIRAEELNLSQTCEDEETLMWRKKSNQILRDSFGLTDAEIAMLERDDLSEADQKKLEEKITKAMLGDLDVNALEQQAAQYEGKSEEELVAMMGNRSVSALDEVYNRNAADIRKYMGVSPAELQAATRAQMNAANPDKECPEMAALNSKVKAYQKEQAAKDPSFQKQANAFEQKMRQETMNATMSASGLGSLGGMMGQISQMQKKVAPIIEMEQKMAAYFNETQKLMFIPDEDVDAAFSANDRKRILSLKEQIYKTDDPKVYNPLYLQALELIKTYRERAAKVWVADVQKRFDAVKNNMAALIKLNRQAVADEILPECALYRMPLNAVIVAGDILEGAYSEFPSDYPPMYQEEVVREVSLGSVPGEAAHGWFPEFSVFSAAQFDDIVAGRYIFASNADGEVYQFNAGSWSKLSDDRLKELNNMKKTASPAGQRWTSQDGKREVVYNAEMGNITLPEGDIIVPDAWKATGNKIQWTLLKTLEETNKVQVILCTYKL